MFSSVSIDNHLSSVSLLTFLHFDFVSKTTELNKLHAKQTLLEKDIQVLF